MLTGQFLPDNIGIAIMTEETLTKPLFQTIKSRLANRLLIYNRAACTKVTANGIARAAKLLRYAFGSPAMFMKLHHRHDFFRLKHLISLHCR